MALKKDLTEMRGIVIAESEGERAKDLMIITRLVQEGTRVEVQVLAQGNQHELDPYRQSIPERA